MAELPPDPPNPIADLSFTTERSEIFAEVILPKPAAIDPPTFHSDRSEVFQEVTFPHTAKGILKHLAKDPQTLVYLDTAPDSVLSSVHNMMSADDVRHYTRQLLQALAGCHRRHVIHGNVQLQNVLVDHRRRVVQLADMSRAQYYRPNVPNRIPQTFTEYHAPELLLKHGKYDYGVDVWAVGVVLAGLVFQCEHVYSGKTAESYIYNIAQLLGGRSLNDFVTAHRIDWPLNDQTRAMRKQPWANFVNTANVGRVSPELYDLLDRLLEINPERRISAEAALNHAYFHSDRVSVVFRATTVIRAMCCARTLVQSDDQAIKALLDAERTRVRNSDAPQIIYLAENIANNQVERRAGRSDANGGGGAPPCLPKQHPKENIYQLS